MIRRALILLGFLAFLGGAVALAHWFRQRDGGAEMGGP